VSAQLSFVHLEDIKKAHKKDKLAFLTKIHSILSQVTERKDGKGRGGANDLVKNALALVYERFQFVISVDSTRNNQRGNIFFVYGLFMVCYVLFMFCLCFLFMFCLCFK
jgi:hypothetical protein